MELDMADETTKKTRYVFAVFASEAANELADLITKNISDKDRLQLPSGDWLVADDTPQTSKIFEKIIQGHDEGSVSMIVARADRMYGWHDSAIWEWVEGARNGSE